MATTTNFGWDTPDDTDYVTDGAAAMRELGQDIDTTLVDLKGGTTGQMLTKATNTDMDFVWASPNPGDITAVTAGTGISGGGTSGDVTITNSMATAIDAKGDLIAGTGADAFSRLAVGNNGETLVADSSTSTGLRYSALFGANKNKIINGDFNINQRAFTSTTATGYNFDRWRMTRVGGTITVSPETFTLGAAPVAGYEGTNFCRLDVTGQSAAGDYAIETQYIESVRTFAGQTVTVSLWAKTNTAAAFAVDVYQDFGTGGSPSATVQVTGQKTATTTNWTRYSFTFAIPSISGKTLGTNNNNFLALRIWASAGSTYNSQTNSLGTQTVTLDIWGVQVEAGSVATAFQTATGTIQGELAACQRYYFRNTPGSLYGGVAPSVVIVNTTTALVYLQFPVTMRTTPTSAEWGNLMLHDSSSGNYALSAVTVTALNSGPNIIGFEITSSGLTANRTGVLRNNNNAAGYLGFSAEL